MKSISKAQFYENLKVGFRSAAKREAYEYLVLKLWERRRDIVTCKTNVTLEQRKLKTLKADYKALQSLLEEFKK